MTNKDEKDFQGQDPNSAEYKELTQKQAEAASEGDSAEEKKEDVKKAENEVNSKDHHEGHVMPDRPNFNQYDNTAEQYDKAQGSPADPDLKDEAQGPIVDREGTTVDAGYDALTGEQADTTGSADSNYQTGKPESKDDEESDK